MVIQWKTHISSLQEWHAIDDEDQSRSERFTAGIIGYLAALFANVPRLQDMLSDIAKFINVSLWPSDQFAWKYLDLLDFTI